MTFQLLCHHFRKESEEHCDTVRLDLICRMLKTPMFNTRMNGLKEVSRLIDESDRGHYQSGRKGIISISSNRLAIWMAKNRVLSVALEGNLDQTQYAERLKAIVEFLGPRLGQEDIDRMWQLLDTSTSMLIRLFSLYIEIVFDDSNYDNNNSFQTRKLLKTSIAS